MGKSALTCTCDFKWVFVDQGIGKAVRLWEGGLPERSMQCFEHAFVPRHDL